MWWVWAIAFLLLLVVTGDVSDDGGPLDTLGDDLVSLTTTDESRLSQLEATTQDQVRGLISDLAAQGLSVKVGQTLRSPAAEKAAQSSGKSAETDITLPSGKVITPSWHLIGRAVDLYPIDPATGEADTNGSNVDLFHTMVDAATTRGFRSLAFNSDGSRHYLPTGVWDGGHLEWRAPYSTLAEAIAAEGPAYGLA